MSNEFFTPQSRNEAILQNICGANNVLPDPQSKIEKLLQAILYEDETLVDFTPESRMELLLYAILTHGECDVEPQSRNETILKAILTNGDYDALPQSRFEALLIEWLDQTHCEEKTVSGDVVSISDAVSAPVADLTAAIVPVQSGSGDPYPPGGGKNLLNQYEVITQRYIKNNGDVLSSPGWSVSGYIRVTAGSTYVLNIQNTGTAAYHAFYDANKEFVSSVISTTSPITIPSGVFYIRLSMKTVDPATAQFELGSTSTAFAPYSNIRPISGWTECNVTRAGKNLLKTTATTTTQAGATWTVNDDGSITASGTPTAYSGVTVGDAYVYGIRGIVNIFANVSTANNVAFADISLYDKNNTQLHRVYTGGFVTTHTVDLSQYPECKYIRVGLKRNNNNVAVSGTYTVQVELGSAATDFEPYRGDTYTVTFGSAGTVYGGTIDVTAGALTVYKAIVDLGTLTWERHASYSELFTGRQLDPMAKYVSGAGTVRHICSIYKSEASNSVIDVDYSVAISGNGKLVYVHDSSYSTPQEFTAAMSGVKLVYELDAPIVYHLTPVEIRTLTGQNTIWADTGDVTVTYKAQRTAAALMMMAGRF